MKQLFKKVSLFVLFFANICCISCNQKVKPTNERCIVELIGTKIDYPELVALAQKNGADDTQLYRWKNHVVLYAYFKKIEAFKKQLIDNFPDIEIKIYNKPYYNFLKAERCPESSAAPKWKHILLTARLVDNKKKQQEYMEYHKTQFEKWPEIAEGFCNADFQQLVCYRNGRQLMLVISIPADKTLDELNPKTVENNPRMDEWNKIMSKYQEGINGTNPGETWVFLNKIENK